jgi:2-polyprenyl-6-methoxyphenol hydroxylase-like FAD-dependent oxidoreductase
MNSDRVLIVGAGPVGVTLALLLGQRGIPVTVLEAEARPIIDYRASTFHPPTMDMLEASGITSGLLAMGRVCPTFQYRDRREGKIAEFDLSLLRNDTRHPYRVQCEQFKLVDFVLRRLSGLPEVDVRFSHRVDEVAQSEDSVAAFMTTPGGTERLAGRWLVGTDGGRSTVRKSLGIEFEGLTYPERFLVAGTTFNFRTAIPDLCSVHYIADADEWVTLLEIPDMWRFITPVHEVTDDAALADGFIESRLQGFVPRGTRYDVQVRAIYRAHQRVAATYRQGRAFLAGDAAHLNNPIGGMGLNGGLHDALDLAERLAHVWRDEADAALLDGYERKRKPVAVDAILAQTAQNKRLLEERDPVVRRQTLERWRRMAGDPELAYWHLLQTSMIASLRAAEQRVA